MVKRKTLFYLFMGFTVSKSTWEDTKHDKRIPSYMKENPDIAANFDFRVIKHIIMNKISMSFS